MPFAHWTQCRLPAFLWVQTHVVNCPDENCPNAFTLRRATPVMRAHRACLCDFVPAADLFSRLSAFTDRQDAAGRATTARHTKAWSSFAPPTCRMPLGQYQGIPRADPGGKGHPPVLTSPNRLSTLLRAPQVTPAAL